MKMGLIHWPNSGTPLEGVAEEILKPSAIRKTHGYHHERGMCMNIYDIDLNFKLTICLIGPGNIEFQISANGTRNSCYASSYALVLWPVLVE